MKLEFSEFMGKADKYVSSNWDNGKCSTCGGTGLFPIICCNGLECGCMGSPVDFADCNCGAKAPTDEELSKMP